MDSVEWPTRDLLAHRAAATPDRTALVAAESGESWTYRGLDERVGRVAGGLARFAGSGDRVGVLLDTRTAFAELVHAAMRLRAMLVPLNVRLTPGELRAQVTRADLDLLA